MGKATKTSEGTWRIQIMVRGVRDGGTFPTKRAADDWQARRRGEIIAAATGKVGTVKTLLQALHEYAEKVSPRKRGEAKEIIRLRAFEKQGLPLHKKLSDVTTQELSEWRDARLGINARGSVLRDMTLLGHLFEVARKEWKWIGVNPMKDVSRPQNPDHREVVISNREIRVMLRTMKYSKPVRSVSNAVAHCFLLALSTGMRAGELCAIKWTDVKTDYVVLHVSKTGKGRQVPLSGVGRKIISQMRGWDPVTVFGLSSQSLDANFRKYRNRAGLKGFTFHDSRHTACTRIGMSGKVTEMILCRMMGWKNPKQAMVYFNPTASEVAALL